MRLPSRDRNHPITVRLIVDLERPGGRARHVRLHRLQQHAGQLALLVEADLFQLGNGERCAPAE